LKTGKERLVPSPKKLCDFDLMRNGIDSSRNPIMTVRFTYIEGKYGFLRLLFIFLLNSSGKKKNYTL